MSLVSVHDGLALIAKCLESPRAKAGPLERRVLDLIDRVPAWLEKMQIFQIEGTKWPREVADKAMSGLARVIEKEFGGQHRRAMEAATYLTWAMQGPPGSRRAEIYARFMMGMKAVYSVYRLGDVLDAQWIGKKWDEIYPGLKQVDEATETSDGFDEIVVKLVDEVVAEIKILCDTGLDLPSGVSPSHTEDGVSEDEDPIGDEGGISNEDFEPNSAPISDLPAWEPMLLDQLSPQEEVISDIPEADGESEEESMTDAETVTVGIPSGTASDSLWLWPQTTGPIPAFSGAPMLARSARVLAIR